MSVDSAPIVQGIGDFLNQVIGNIPLGLRVIGIPAAIVTAITFAYILVNYMMRSFGQGGLVNTIRYQRRLAAANRAAASASGSGSRRSPRRKDADEFEVLMSTKKKLVLEREKALKKNAKRKQSVDAFMSRQNRIFDSFDKKEDKSIFKAKLNLAGKSKRGMSPDEFQSRSNKILAHEESVQRGRRRRKL